MLFRSGRERQREKRELTAINMTAMMEGIEKAIRDSLAGVVRMVETSTRETDTKITNINKRIDRFENTKIANTRECKNLRRCASRRVYELLGTDERIVTICRGQFYSSIYGDAKRESRLGDPIGDTLEKDVEEVKQFLNTWTPLGLTRTRKTKEIGRAHV